MKASKAMACSIVVLMLVSACGSSAQRGDPPATDRPTAAVSSGPPRTVSHLGQSVSAGDTKRAKGIVESSPVVRRAVGDTTYDIVEYIPGTSGTVPDVSTISVILRLSHPVEVPAGLPCWNLPGEGDPGYGTPVPLASATRPYAAAHDVMALNAGVDMSNGMVLVLVPWVEPMTS